jgi:hypothetical protein
MYKNDNTTPKFLTAFGLAALTCWGGVVMYKGVRFDQDIGGHLELAASANSIPLAEEQMGIAIAGIDAWNICPPPENVCFTSIFYRTPDDDVAFWRRNLQQAHDELEKLQGQELDKLTESNQLIKLRETLMRSGSEGASLDRPQGISRYPSNVAFCVWGSLSFALSCIGAFWWGLREQ